MAALQRVADRVDQLEDADVAIRVAIDGRAFCSRQRAEGELSRGKLIVPFDTDGRAAIEAALALRAMGFARVEPLNGGVTFWRGELV